MSQTRLVVIAGPPQSGKIAAMWAVAARDPALRIIHRDQVRVLFGRLLDEADLTIVMSGMASSLLALGYGVVTAAQNQTDWDRQTWERVALGTGTNLEWIDTGAVGLEAVLAQAV